MTDVSDAMVLSISGVMTPIAGVKPAFDRVLPVALMVAPLEEEEEEEEEEGRKEDGMGAEIEVVVEVGKKEEDGGRGSVEEKEEGT